MGESSREFSEQRCVVQVSTEGLIRHKVLKTCLELTAGKARHGGKVWNFGVWIWLINITMVEGRSLQKV